MLLGFVRVPPTDASHRSEQRERPGDIQRFVNEHELDDDKLDDDKHDDDDVKGKKEGNV